MSSPQDLADKLESLCGGFLSPLSPGDTMTVREAAACVRETGLRIGKLEAALQYVDDCFNAALAEGWIDALANNDRDLIEDIWRRRISYAWSNTLNVLQDSPAAERTKDASEPQTTNEQSKPDSPQPDMRVAG